MNRYPVDLNTIVTFTAKADENVIAYGAKLFLIDKDGNSHEKEQWLSDELKGGVKFTFKATGDEGYEIDLGATLDEAAAVIKTTMEFSKHPPSNDSDDLALDPSEPGDIIRYWEFVTKKGAAKMPAAKKNPAKQGAGKKGAAKKGDA